MAVKRTEAPNKYNFELSHAVIIFNYCKFKRSFKATNCLSILLSRFITPIVLLMQKQLLTQLGHRILIILNL